VRDRHILTCAHIITDVLGLSSDGVPPDWAKVYLNFPLLAPNEYFSAHVCHWQPDADVAGLKMTSEGAAGAKSVRLVTADDLCGHSFRALGFPASHGNGMWTSGVLRGRTAAGWVQIDDVKVPGYWVQPGFSGTPYFSRKQSDSLVRASSTCSIIVMLRFRNHRVLRICIATKNASFA